MLIKRFLIGLLVEEWMVEDLEVDVASSDFNCMLNANILNGDFSGVLKLVVLLRTHSQKFTFNIM